jgi:hypothetical protein
MDSMDTFDENNSIERPNAIVFTVTIPTTRPSTSRIGTWTGGVTLRTVPTGSMGQIETGGGSDMIEPPNVHEGV